MEARWNIKVDEELDRELRIHLPHHELVANGMILAVRIGRSIRVNRKELDCWLEDCSYTDVCQR